MIKKKQNITETPIEIIIEHGDAEEIIETSIDLPELNLVRMDMNIVEYPLFSKNKRRKVNQSIRYKLNGRADKYIEVRPIAGETIPGDFEEKVFIALINIMRKNNYSKNFVVTISEIADNMNVSNYTKKAIHSQIKSSLIKLSETSYTFKDALYSNIKNEILSDIIVTNIMSIRIISKKDANAEDKDRYFKDGRVKEIYLIAITQHFYDNIINKGYLVFDSKLLLTIGNSISRAIHMLITKLRFNDLVYRIGLISLAGRIPLKVDKKNIGRSAKSIEKACVELRNKNLIENFKFIKIGNWENAEIEFYFTEEHNKIKQNNFYMEKDLFKGLYLNAQDINSDNVSEDFYNSSDDIELIDNGSSDENVEKVFNILPAKAKNLKTIKNLIYNSIIQYDFDRVFKAAMYTAEKNPDKIYGYFKKAIQCNYGADIPLKKERKKKISSQLSLEDLKNSMLLEHYPYYEKYETLDFKLQNQVYYAAMKEYTSQLKKNPYLSDSFRAMCIKNAEKQFEADKKKLINDFMEKHKNNFEFFENENKKETVLGQEIVSEKLFAEETEKTFEINDKINNNYMRNEKNLKEKMLNLSSIRDYITKSIEGYSAIILLDEETEKRLRKELSIKITPLIIESELPRSIVDELIKEEIKKL